MVADILPVPVTDAADHPADPGDTCPRCFGGVWAYALLGLALVAFVALLTGQRSESLGADAWEHHAAVVALIDDPWQPGNPTYATDDPSIRYSPYSLLIAHGCRLTGASAYAGLSVAAVINTALLVVALWLLLLAFRATGIALPTLVATVLIYGAVPRYANSLNLSDLPWHQVNPSAFALPLVVFAWALVVNARVGCGGWLRWSVSVLLVALAMLSHGMTGVLGGVGWLALALTQGAGAARTDALSRGRLFMMCFAGSLAVGLLCLAWPWYPFLGAVRGGDHWYWYNPGVVKLMLGQWVLPGYVLCLLALPWRRHPAVRFALIGAGLTLGLGLLSILVKSPTLARLPLAGLLFAHLALGWFIAQARLLDPRTYPGLLRMLFAPQPGNAARAFTQLIVAASLAVGFVMAGLETVKSPWLARGYIAEALGRDPELTRPFERYREALAPTAPGDVVFARPITGWPVPSLGQRVVAAYHLERFTPDQRQRLDDVERFFSDAAAERAAIADRYNATWLLVDTRRFPEDAVWVRPGAVAAEADGLVLMHMDRWLDASPPAPPAPPNPSDP